MALRRAARLSQRANRARPSLLTLTTAAVSPEHAFAYWREVISQHFIHLRPEPVRRERFFSAIDAQTLSGYSFSRVRAGAQRVHRTGREIARSPHDLVFLNVHVSGAGSYKQNGDERTLRPGDVFVIDAAAPFELGCGEGIVQLSLKAPRALLWDRMRRPGDAPGALIPRASWVGKLIGDYAGALWRGEDADGLEAADQLFALAGFEFGRRTGAAATPRTALRAAIYAHAKAHIRKTCADPALTPWRTASQLGVSLRTLQAIFAKRGDAIGRRIQAARLDAASAMLAAPELRHRKIGEIAFLAGFSELSHFTHAFARAYGAAPGAWRRRRLDNA